ncbi:MAG: hypothetical protein LQ352_001085 [Teloschistes flavicans]|nr:MAG: hypothetical protein LQ352_001085 [Teloschistes flavicans]
MLVPTLLSAGFVLTTQAFLIPPEAAKTFEQGKDNVASHVIDPFSRTVTLDCSNCPYTLASRRNGRHEWTNDIRSDLQLKFTAENDKLKLNGISFYPVAPPFTLAPLVAKQIKKPDDESVVAQASRDQDVTLSYSLEFDNEKKHFPASGQDATLTEITLSILGLDNEVVHVDDIKIKALSTATIDDLALNPQQVSLYVYLRTIAFVQASLERITTGTPITPLFSFVILPVLVGIVFGIAASAIGMIVGQIIVAVWLRLRRKSSTTVAYAPVAMEEKEGLPKYEDLDDTKTVVDEKV